MMILSRMWYVILAILVAAAFYIVSLAVGQYNRRNYAAMDETLKADSQVVGWALQLDARRRLDSLLLATVDPGVTKSVKAANGKEPVPATSKDEGAKALQKFNGGLPDEYKSDALFITDREGRLVAQTGYDSVNAFEKFELGGYPAVFDALHGFLRDDTWVLGGKLARVVARPIEDEVGAPPVGAVVALKWMDRNYAKEIAKRTRTNVAFFALGQLVSTAATMDGFDEKQLESLGADLVKVEADAQWKEGARTDLRPLGTEEQGGVIFARIPGDAWELGGGFAVARPRVMITSPLGFIQGADDKDKASVKLPVVIGIFLGTVLFGFLFSHLEHTSPLKGMLKQTARLKKGEIDAFQLPQFRGKYRAIAADVNEGIQRIVEKGGGATRKPADLQSILGPVPAQPAMSAFSFPMSDPSAAPAPAPSGPGAAPPGPPPPAQRFGHAPAPAPSGPSPTGSGPQLPPPGLAPPPPAAGAPPPPAPSGGGMSGTMAASPQAHGRLGVAGTVPAAFPPAGPGPNGEEEQTMVAQPSADLLAATGAGPAAGPAVDPTAEWKQVYEEFLRTKRECGEPTDGLTFEKFQQTLRKNRDALVTKHGCKRVKFSVYVKEGRASLKATPVRE